MKGQSFAMLINGMAQPALLFLGEIPHPSTGHSHVAAKALSASRRPNETEKSSARMPSQTNTD